MNHQFWINQVKKKTKASFVAWETSTKDGLRLKISFGKNTEPQYLGVTGTIENVTVESYLKLLNEL
jgi:hypothetical protein